MCYEDDHKSQRNQSLIFFQYDISDLENSFNNHIEAFY